MSTPLRSLAPPRAKGSVVLTVDISPGSSSLGRIGRNLTGLFEHCVGAQQERLRNREANGFCSLEIDGQLEFRRLLYGHVFRLLALQDFLHKPGAMPNRGGPIRPE